MTKMGADGAADERFVDVFRSGVLLNRCAAPTRRMRSAAPCCRAWQMSQIFHMQPCSKSSSMLAHCFWWGAQQRPGVRARRRQVYALMAEMGVGINDEMLSAVGAADVYLRSCANLANQQYRLGVPLRRSASSNCSDDIHSNDRPVTVCLRTAGAWSASSTARALHTAGPQPAVMFLGDSCWCYADKALRRQHF